MLVFTGVIIVLFSHLIKGDIFDAKKKRSDKATASKAFGFADRPGPIAGALHAWTHILITGEYRWPKNHPENPLTQDSAPIRN